MGIRRFHISLFVAGGLAVLAGCESDLTNPANEQSLEGEALLFETVNYTRLEESADRGAVRVEIELRSNSLVAKAVAIASGDELADEEEIRGRAKGMEVNGSAGSLTLELGDLVVTFDNETRFRVAGGDDLTFDDFVAEVDAALASSVHPALKVARDPPATPQDPDDAAFHADEIRLDAELEKTELALNVDRDNLVRNDSPPPDGWLHVLGLEIELRVSDGLTEIEVERPDVDVVEFEGVVTDVDLDARSFTLDDGTVVKMIDRTDMMESDGSRHRLDRLAAVKEALEEGLTVVAFGKGAVESSDPLVLIAVRVGFEVDASTLEEFSGVIASVQLDARSLTLEDGTVIRLIGLTNYGHSDDWNLTDDVLARVAEAVANGHRVTAGGVGVVVGDDPLTLIALKIRFALAPPPLEEFGGVVTDVDLDANSFTLDNGTIIVLPRLTDAGVSADGYGWPFPDLNQVVEAMKLGLTVAAGGKGVVVAAEPLTIQPVRLRFELESDGATEFGGDVVAADLDARTFTLSDGQVIGVLGLTTFGFGFDGVAETSMVGTQPETDAFFDPLALVARALAAGLAVQAEGMAAELADGSWVALSVEFVVELPTIVEFKGIVEDVDVDAQSFTLDDGTVVQWPYRAAEAMGADSRWTPWPSIEGLAESVEAGLTVWAHGSGIEVTDVPLVVAALRVEFEVSDADAEKFEGEVTAIDPAAKTVSLDDGTVIQVVALTAVRLGDDGYAIGILTRLAQALADHTVTVEGLGLHVSDNPTTFVGILLKFALN